MGSEYGDVTVDDYSWGPGFSGNESTMSMLHPGSARRERLLSPKTIAWSFVGILGLAGVAVTFTAMNYVSEVTTEEEASYGARSDKIVALVPGDELQSDAATIEETTEMLRHHAASSSARPDRLPEPVAKEAVQKPTEASQVMTPPAPTILCTIGFPKQDHIPREYPDDGVCDVLVLHVELQGGAVVSYKYEEIIAKAQQSNRTQYGLDIANDEVVGIFKDMQESQELMGLHEAWTNGIRHYGRLYNVLGPDTTVRDVAALTNLLTVLRNSQRYWSDNEDEFPYYIFLGVQVLFKYQSEMWNGMRDPFQQLIREGRPTILVFDIVYSRPHMSAAVCRLTAPTVYKDAPVVDQPTIKHTVEFYTHFSSMIPKHIQIMFSVTPCGRAGTFAPQQNTTIGSSCFNSTLSTVMQWLCRADLTRNVAEPKRQIGISRSYNGSYVITYETKRTLGWKICHAYVHASITSWAILGVGCSPYSGFCKNTKLYGGYEFPVWVKNRTEGLLSICRQS